MADYYVSSDGKISKGKKSNQKVSYKVSSSGKVTKVTTNTKKKKKKEEEIAPVKKNTWFKAGGFSDGVDGVGDFFGDLAETTVGTLGDALVGVGKGVTRLGEGIVDLGAYGVAEVADKLGKDKYATNLRKKAIKDWTTNAWKKAEDKVDKYSVLGNKSDAVTEGLGQVLGIVATGGIAGALGAGGGVATAITTGATGLSGMGSGMSEAYQNKATDKEAWTYGAIAGTAEAATELLFGGLGKTVKALGISKGLSSADDMLAKKITSKFTNQIAKNFAEYGIKAGAEGTEEVLSGIAQAWGKSVTYMDEKDLKELIKDEDLLDQFIVGAITSGIAQSGYVPGMTQGSLREANKTGTDFISGLTQNEQKVVDKEYENRIAEAEESGDKLSTKEKNKIYDEVVDDLEKGRISIDTIESAIGGETYKTYKNMDEQEKAVRKQIEELENTPFSQITVKEQEKLTELRKQLETMEKSGLKNKVKAQLSSEVSELALSTKLSESYNEQTRRSQAFQADLTKYDAKQQDTIKKATESGILNNSNRTHEFVDLVAKISADKGVTFDFTNNKKLKESGFAVEGKTVNGYVKDGNIAVNIDSNKSLNSIVGHEITHTLEGTEHYNELQQAIKEYAKTKGEYFTRRDEIVRLYNDSNVENVNIGHEVTADLVGDYLFTDKDFINNLSTEKPNIFKRIYDEIKYLCKIATAGSKEARQLEKVKRAFDKAYKESASNTDTSTDTKVDTETSPSDNIKKVKRYSDVDKNDNIFKDGWLKANQKMVDEIVKNRPKTETDNFKSWFGESKAVNQDGEPLLLYHGTDSRFTKFASDGKAMWLSTELLYAREYSKPIKKSDEKVPSGKVFGGSIDRIIPAYIRAEKPADFGNTHLSFEEALSDVSSKLDIPANELKSVWEKVGKPEKLWQVVNSSEMVDLLKKHGYDSIKAIEDTAPTWAVFESNQIKSAVANKGTFDSNKSDIRYSLTDSNGKELTKEQQEFFKDSKVRDENGNLKAMYHGTGNSGFHEFSNLHSGDGRSFFFIDTLEGAKGYSGVHEVYEAKTMHTADDVNKYLEEINEDDYYKVTEEDGEFVLYEDGDEMARSDSVKDIFDELGLVYGSANYKVYLNLKNPLIIDAKNNYWDELDLSEITGATSEDENTTREVAEYAQKNGYDGVIFKNVIDTGLYASNNERFESATVAVAFDSNQIKSVANENPTTDADIRHSLSDKGQNTAPYGNYNVYGKDVALEKDTTPINTQNVVEDIAPLTEEQANARDAELEQAPVAEPIVKDEFKKKTKKKVKEVNETPTSKLENAETEIANLEQLKQDSYDSYTDKINKLQNEYEAKKNKDTKVANNILRRIERLKRSRADVEADYTKRLENANKRKDLIKRGHPTTRSEHHTNIINSAKEEFAKRGYDLDKVLENAKNLSTFATRDNTPQRVMEKTLGYKEGNILSDLTVNKLAQNESKAIKWLDGYTNRKTGVLAELSREYKIKPGSKESAAAQMYAEGFYVDEKNNVVKYGDKELAKDFPNEKARNRIKGLATDPRIRKIYDETLDLINESRARNVYDEIPRRKDYFLHFRAMDDTFSRLGIPFNPNDIRAKDLPTDLNGVTADLMPGQPYFASAKRRMGNKTSHDLLGGLEKYLTSAKGQIFHIDDIQNLRALRNYIADKYGQAHGLENLHDMSEEDFRKHLEEVYNGHLSTFAGFLNEEANAVAGKTALIDRGIEGIFGRRALTFLKTVNKQVGSNMVGFNVSSSGTNFLPVVQTFAKTNKVDFFKAFTQTVSNKIRSIYGESDGFMENNPTMLRRNGADVFYRTPYQKAVDAGQVLMGAVDNISTELIVRTKYNEYVRKGMNHEDAVNEADKWASRLMGDRSLGQQPQHFNSDFVSLFTKFQLEVRNQLDAQFYDTIQEAKLSNEEIQNKLLRNAKISAKVASTFTQLAVAQHLFGTAFEKVVGYNPSFDVIETLIKVFGFDDDEDSEDTVLDNIEQGFLNLLEDLPYASVVTGGGRIPISSALPIKEFAYGKDEYGKRPRSEIIAEAIPYYLLPTGYGQIKKSYQGLSMFDDDLPISGSYTESGNLRFPIADTTENKVKAGLFGQWANENARTYFDKEIAPLKEKQIKEFIDVDMPINDYWEYREGLKEQKTIEDKFDYIDSLDLPTKKKNILINNIVDRKEDVDMENYSQFPSYEEFDFYSKNPEKYSFLQENNISYNDYKESKESKKAYTWAYNNPEKYAVSKVISNDFMSYWNTTQEIFDIRADKDSKGKTINGTGKAKKINYINNLDMEYGKKIVLFKMLYVDDDTYNNEVIDYLNSREDITYEEQETILKQLGFTVTADGNIYWD